MAAQCVLVTDSPCDLPESYLKENDVYYIPYSYNEFGNKLVDSKGKPRPALEGVDDMFTTMTPHDFYEAMKKGAAPHTSQPSQAEYEQVFRKVIDRGEPAVYLCFSSGLSGAYNGAVAALDRLREEYAAEGKSVQMSIVDLRIGSTTQALFISEAIRQRDRGLTADEMVRWAEEARWYVQTIFMVDDLHALRRGGRIPSGVAYAGSVLDVKPLLTFDTDGRLAMMGVCRGRKKAIRKMAKYYEDNHNTDMFSAVACIGNADCYRDVERLEDLIRKVDDSTMFLEVNIGPTIGCHVGPGMLSCCFWGSDRRKDMSASDKIAHDIQCKKN